MAGVCNPQTHPTVVSRALALVLLLCALRVFGATAPGKVVWWGQGSSFYQSSFMPTNGVVESEHEIVSNAVAVVPVPEGAIVHRQDGGVVGVGRAFRDGNAVPAVFTNALWVGAEGGWYWACCADGSTVRYSDDAAPSTAEVVPGLSNVVSIVSAIGSVGFHHYFALRHDGAVLGFRLDTPELEIKPVTVGKQVLTQVSALAPRGYAPLVLKRDGTLMYLESQAPEDPPGLDHIPEMPYHYASLQPMIVSGQALSNVVDLCYDDDHFVALKQDGTVVAWRQQVSQQTVVSVGLTNVVAVDIAVGQVLALKADGTVATAAWGNDAFGRTWVPAGLSNVVAIAALDDFNLAITTGNLPASVYIPPHGRLEEMEREADLVFKGQVLASRAITNAAFPDWGQPHATTLEVISVFKGKPVGKELKFLHLTQGPGGWSGGDPPPHFNLKVGESYLVFAARADRPDFLYAPSAQAVQRPGQLRQLMHGQVPIRTRDRRPREGLSTKAAHWEELNLLLRDSNPTNQLYAIEKLDLLSLAGRPEDYWARSEDFQRWQVLQAVLPCVTHPDERVAARAINCFRTDTNAAVRLRPFAGVLVEVANTNPSARLRLYAIRALSGTEFAAVSNSLARLLREPSDALRARTVAVLGRYPGEFAEQALRRAAEDPAPMVRASVADVIGNAKWSPSLPVLTRLFADPVGRAQPVAPLTLEELEGGGRSFHSDGGIMMTDEGLVLVEDSHTDAPGADVHTSAGYALLEFDLSQTRDILQTNLSDAGFRLQFLLKLAEPDPAPWLKDLAQLMEARRVRNLEKARTNGAPPETYMYLSGAYFRCWRLFYNYLDKLPAAQLADKQNERYLKVLEEAGNTGSQEPVQLYELYRKNGLTQRAAEFRRQATKAASYDLNELFNRVDAQYPVKVLSPGP